MNRLFAFTLLLFAASPAFAADANGYTAQYECRAGGQYCNVDVASLGNRTCDQIVSTSTPWSSINWSNSTICLEAGDHTGKGTLTIPLSANGTSGNYKVLRYYRSGDTNDEPWNQSSANKAKLLKLHIDSANYWIIHRLSFPGTTVSSIQSRVWVDNTTGGTPTNIILNRLHILGSGFNNVLYYGVAETKGSNITLQNSVVGEYYGGSPPSEAVGVSFEQGSNNHIVNNEIYDYAGHPIQIGQNNGPTMGGFVIENNDVYQSTAMQTNGGTTIRGEDPISIKAGAKVDNNAQVIHNRVWGGRTTDYTLCCNGSGGGGIVINQLPVDEVFPEGGYSSSGSYQFTLLKNNIIFDSQWGLGWYPSGAEKNSVIGNIFYKIRDYDTSANSGAIFIKTSSSEFYLNSFINNSSDSINYSGGASNDIRCNILLSGGLFAGSPPASAQADYNAFYDTPSFSYNGTNTNKVRSVSTRKNATHYTVDDIIQTGPTEACKTPSDSACFLYKVVTAGTTDGNAPPYCTSLGCPVTDGTVSLQAIRGPYTFYRKLRTSPEPYTIPYARAHASAPEATACPSEYAKRLGVGINDVN